MKNFMIVAAGAVPGALIRFVLQSVLNQGGRIPWGTLLSNLSGCFLAGIILSCGENWSQTTKNLMVAGALGSFTTFSSFVTEVAGMCARNSYYPACVYFLLTIFMTLAACWAGWLLGQKIMLP